MALKKIPIKSGGFAYLCDTQQEFLPGEICFLADEWAYTKRLSSSMHDPDDLKGFWETLLSKKRGSITYLITDDFPLSVKPEPPMPDNHMVDHVGGIIEKLRKEGKIKP